MVTDIHWCPSDTYALMMAKMAWHSRLHITLYFKHGLQAWDRGCSRGMHVSEFVDSFLLISTISVLLMCFLLYSQESIEGEVGWARRIVHRERERVPVEVSPR